jgi:hypothetical protein
LSDLTSFDELYNEYRAYFKAKGLVNQQSLPIISKQFFEKFLTNQLSLYVKFDKFVSSDWIKL